MIPQCRGKTKDGRKWVEGWYFYEKLNKKHFILVEPSFLADVRFNAIVGHIEVIPESVAMATGVPDKNKKEIFGCIEINGKMSKGKDKIRITAAKDMFNDDGSISMKEDELFDELTVIFYHGAFWLGSDFIPDKHLLRMILPNGNWQGEIIGNAFDQEGKDE